MNEPSDRSSRISYRTTVNPAAEVYLLLLIFDIVPAKTSRICASPAVVDILQVPVLMRGGEVGGRSIAQYLPEQRQLWTLI